MHVSSVLSIFLSVISVVSPFSLSRSLSLSLYIYIENALSTPPHLDFFETGVLWGDAGFFALFASGLGMDFGSCWDRFWFPGATF